MSAVQKRRLTRLLALLLIATLCFIWGNSLVPREDSAELSGGVLSVFAPLLERLGLDPTDDRPVRKLAHLCEYGALGMELAALFFLHRRRSLQQGANAAFCAFLVAVTDETIQIFSGRGSLVSDVWIDFSGALLGIALLSALFRGAEQKPRP